MPRLSLGLGVQNIRKVGGGGAAPSNISLTAPTIYLSGLSFQDGNDYSNGVLYSPYNLTTPGTWESSETGFVSYFGEWQLYVSAFLEGNVVTTLVATNSALATSLPRTGWTNTNANLIVSGTLVISTTP
jgi:hypothetical protein